MTRRLTIRVPAVLAFTVLLAGCGPRYSPDVYATNAAQQASKVEGGVIIGVRKVRISAAGTTGAATGAAAGGVIGSQAGVGPTGALTTLGGALFGGLAGVAAEHTVSDTDAFEYVVRKPNGDMISVTQADEKALKVGQKVLVIAGAQQARVVPDYTTPADVAEGRPLDTRPVDNRPMDTRPAVKPAPPTVTQPAQQAGPSQPETPGSPPGGQGGPLSSTVLPSGS